ncbi:glycoside hydrolase domain-containing protein [Chondrinema litorale]|uniref:glycoside hydrolase domain-containing protein n=1 Tax=Chondrinema litorale TaxID=2994555 RepID=UPI0025427B7E|nr:glycoside hydrolase domain-containing protein [Chondrinema litorale]UZR96131.1 glycoside hydrolase family 92 protein [Chondrinema litorale]
MTLRLLLLSLLAFTFACQQQETEEKTLDIASQKPTEMVNVFLGSSGDHGQMSPAASYPFSMLSIGPHTYPATHTGYEYYAKEFLGFSHTRLEGVGCQGSGGNILVRPFLGDSWETSDLIKTEDKAKPGYYSVKFENKIAAEFAVADRYGVHHYQFPEGEKGFFIDLSYATVNRFQEEEHHIEGNTLSGWIDTRTTCGAGKYRIYYYMEFSQPVNWQETEAHKLTATVDKSQKDVEIYVALSSVNVEYAKKALTKASLNETKEVSDEAWNELLGHIKVKGDEERMKMFYSLLYRAIQSPYVISEDDGTYRAVDGSVQQSKEPIYNGWAIWDNYRTQLPLLSLIYPDEYQNISASIANLYPYGKRDFATENEPSPTVRTEHAIPVLWDAYQKGYKIDFEKIAEYLIKESETLDYSHPDKALEASYDAWALSKILASIGRDDLSEQFKKKALEYKKGWVNEFKDLTKDDVDRMGARGMYQGTIWQYRWFVPFDQKGLIELIGGEEQYLAELDEFFGHDYYNHANQPDLQTTKMYQGTSQPWKSQAIIHKVAVDTVIQHYFNNNSRGTGSYVGKIYKNDPATYLPTMDDDAGTMSSWYVWASSGIFPACVGEPVYYLHAPLMEEVSINWPEGEPLTIKVTNYNPDHAYIKEATFNGKSLNKNWLTHKEIRAGGELVITTSAEPNKNWGTAEPFLTSFQ